MSDYTKAKLYKISNDYIDDIYVGSTCDTLVKRFSYHKSDSKRESRKHYPLYTLMNEIGFERFRIQLIEDYPCEDKYQLTQREGYWIRTTGSLNTRVEGRTLQESKKAHNEKNKIAIAEYKKEYHEKNKETFQETH